MGDSDLKPIPITNLPAGATIEGQIYEDATVAYLFDKLATIRLVNGIEVQIWWESWNKAQPFVVRVVEGNIVKDVVKTACPWAAALAADVAARNHHTDDKAEVVAEAKERFDAAMVAYEVMWSRAGGYAFLASASGAVAALLMPSFGPLEWPVLFALAIGLACWAADIVVMAIALKRLGAAMIDVNKLIDEKLGEDAGR